ncbi:MAG: hypothetical protein EP312_00030, partial [Gammaproteobacteria bacterium]
CADMQAAPASPGKFFGNARRKPVLADHEAVSDSKFRFIDFHINSPAAREAIFSPAIRNFLHQVYEAPVLAFQSLLFRVGSQQRMHQDTAYVVISKPYKLTATWIALEDIAVGSGELQYIPGSHRFPDFLFGGRHKAWVKARDGFEANDAYIDALYQMAESQGLPVESFIARKGDVLVWAADLAHGGSPITDPYATRKSLVTHYCPQGVLPGYGLASPKKHIEVMCDDGCFVSSKNYDLSQYDGKSMLDVINSF